MGLDKSPLTCIHVRLLGPCFKTGRMEHRLFAHRERPSSDSCKAPKELTVGGTRRGHRRIPRVDTRRKLAGRQQAGVADKASLGFLRNSDPFGFTLRASETSLQRIAAIYCRGKITRQSRAGRRVAPLISHEGIEVACEPNVALPGPDGLNPPGSIFDSPSVCPLTVSRSL